MPRTIVDNEAAALGEIGSTRTKPPWMEGTRSLPFSGLTPDEFEVLCFLLLRREETGAEVVYYGKTSDGGRDIVVRRVGSPARFYQCKHYSGTVGVGDVRAELAKLFCNAHAGVLPDRPDELAFFVTTDLSAPAQDLLDTHATWLGAVDAALEEHLGKKPAADLLTFAKTWWPRFRRANGKELSDRVRLFPSLVEQFFAYTKVVEGSLDEIKPLLTSISDRVDRLQVDFQAARSNAPRETTEFLRHMEAENQGLSFSATLQATGETVFTVSPKPGASVKIGELHFPPGPLGDAGKAKLQQMLDYGWIVTFEDGEYEWRSALKVPPTKPGDGIRRSLELRPSLPREPFAVEIACGDDPSASPVIKYTRGKLIRIGRREMEIQFRGGELAGEIGLVLGFGGTASRVNYRQDLPSAPARAARATLDLMLRIARQERITIRSIDFATPLMSFDPGPESHHDQELLVNSLSICTRLEQLASRFNLDLRYPEEVDQGWVREVELAWAAVQDGRVAERVPENLISMPMPTSKARHLLGLWEGQCPATIEGPNSLPVLIGGVAIPLGPRRLILEDAEPVGGVGAFRDLVNGAVGTADDMVTATVAVVRLVHEFPKFIPAADEAKPSAP